MPFVVHVLGMFFMHLCTQNLNYAEATEPAQHSSLCWQVFPWDRTNTLVEEQNRCRSEIQSAVVQAKCMIAFDFVGGAMTGILLSVLPNGGKVYASGEPTFVCIRFFVYEFRFTIF